MALSKHILTGIIILSTLTLSAQNMRDMQKAYQNKWRATFGVGGAEPIAFHAQFYKGFSCKSLRSWLLEVQVGVEGLVYDIGGKQYMDGTWDKGALRYSFSYNRRLFPGLSDYIPHVGLLWGIGVQAGMRNYITEGQEKASRYAVGPLGNVNIEYYAMDRRISKVQYLGVIFFAEYLYHREIESGFYISRFNGGIRLNFYS